MFSSETIYDSVFLTLYNVAYTSLPVLFISLSEKIYPEERLMKYEIYLKPQTKILNKLTKKKERTKIKITQFIHPFKQSTTVQRKYRQQTFNVEIFCRLDASWLLSFRGYLYVRLCNVDQQPCNFIDWTNRWFSKFRYIYDTHGCVPGQFKIVDGSKISNYLVHLVVRRIDSIFRCVDGYL